MNLNWSFLIVVQSLTEWKRNGGRPPIHFCDSIIVHRWPMENSFSWPVSQSNSHNSHVRVWAEAYAQSWKQGLERSESGSVCQFEGYMTKVSLDPYLHCVIRTYFYFKSCCRSGENFSGSFDSERFFYFFSFSNYWMYSRCKGKSQPPFRFLGTYGYRLNLR